jgi:hypothetical protein
MELLIFSLIPIRKLVCKIVHGEPRTVTDNKRSNYIDDPAGRYLNRRVEFKLRVSLYENSINIPTGSFLFVSLSKIMYKWL